MRPLPSEAVANTIADLRVTGCFFLRLAVETAAAAVFVALLGILPC